MCVCECCKYRRTLLTFRTFNNLTLCVYLHAHPPLPSVAQRQWLSGWLHAVRLMCATLSARMRKFAGVAQEMEIYHQLQASGNEFSMPARDSGINGAHVFKCTCTHRVATATFLCVLAIVMIGSAMCVSKFRPLAFGAFSLNSPTPLPTSNSEKSNNKKAGSRFANVVVVLLLPSLFITLIMYPQSSFDCLCLGSPHKRPSAHSPIRHLADLQLGIFGWIYVRLYICHCQHFSSLAFTQVINMNAKLSCQQGRWQWRLPWCSHASPFCDRHQLVRCPIILKSAFSFSSAFSSSFLAFWLYYGFPAS